MVAEPPKLARWSEYSDTLTSPPLVSRQRSLLDVGDALQQQWREYDTDSACARHAHTCTLTLTLPLTSALTLTPPNPNPTPNP